MAVDRAIQFGGMNTELFPNRLREGEADRAVNVIVSKGDLTRRGGFAEYEDDVNGGGAVLSVHTAHFSNGAVYVIAKVGAKWYRRKVSPVAGAEATFTAISGGHTHNSADPGWTFMWDDYIHLCDRAGVSKWNPARNGAAAYKAGLPRPSTGPAIAAAGEGEKDGRYHVAWAMKNSRTDEESVISSQQTGGDMPLEARTGDDNGGIAVINWSTLRGLHTDYEWDEGQSYCSFGHSEWDDQGLGYEKFSFRLYKDTCVPKTQAGLLALNKADSVLDPRTRFTNAGGEPPGARFGCFDGIQAVYGGVYEGAYATMHTAFDGDNNDLEFTSVLVGVVGNSIRIRYTAGATPGAEVVTVSGKDITVQIDANPTTGSTAADILAALQASAQVSTLVSVAYYAGNDGSGRPGATMAYTALAGGGWAGSSLSPDRIDFSIPGKPTMIPAQQTYSQGGDKTTIDPSPWEGRITTGLAGNVTAVVSGGGRIAAFTPTSIIELARTGEYRLVPYTRSLSAGCLAEGGAVGTIGAIYAVGYNSVTKIAGGGMGDLAAERIRPTLEAIPAAARDNTVGGYYGHKRQVWWAIAEPGATKPQSILIYDEDQNAWLTFRPACLGTRAALTTAITGSNNDITYTAERAGAVGNAITIAYAAGATAGEEYITVTGNAATVHVAVGTTTAAEVVALWNSTGDAVVLATAALAAGNNGTGKVAVMGATGLTGGTGDEGITGLTELATPDGAPVMLVATDAGRILQYPAGNQDDGIDYAADWRGYIGQGGAARKQYLEALALMPTANCAGNVRVGVRNMEMGWETPRYQTTDIMHKDFQYWSGIARQGTRHGRVFQVEIFSPQPATAAGRTQWIVSDMHARMAAKV